MKNRKGRREEGLPASCSAQPARPATGPASHRPAPPTRCSQPAARLARPSLRPSVARVPVSLACQPHVAHARASPRLRLQPLPTGPRTSALLCFFPTPHSNHHATEPRQQWQGGPGVMPGAWTCLPLGAAPTQPLVTVGCKQALRLPLIPDRRSPSSMDEVGYKGHGPRSPSARPIARRHLGGHPLRTQT